MTMTMTIYIYIYIYVCVCVFARECPSCGRARSVAVGGTAWGGWVCGGSFYGGHGDKYVERRSRRIGRYICRVQADGGHLKRCPTGTGAVSPAARAGRGWSPSVQ